MSTRSKSFNTGSKEKREIFREILQRGIKAVIKKQTQNNQIQRTALITANEAPKNAVCRLTT